MPIETPKRTPTAATTRIGRPAWATSAMLLLFGASAMSGCDDEDGEGTTEGGEYDDHGLADVEAIKQVGVCFTNGIDLLGSQQVDLGVARWQSCFTEDHSFAFTGQVPGAGEVLTVTCPGPNCPAPPPQMGALSRAQFAAGVFQRSGYVATQHVLTNVVVTVDGDTGTLSSDLIAHHFKPDGSIDLFNGRWETDVVKIDGRWLSQHERALQTSFVTVPGDPLGQPNPRHERDIRALGNCYAHGIDRIGAGDVEGGTATWAQRYAEDFSFDFDFGPAGAGSCPGDQCPAPPPGFGAASRAEFAGGVFAALGYTRTQHLVSNVSVDIDPSGTAGVLSSDLTAFHFVDDGSIDLFNGTLRLDVVLADEGWQVVHESVGFISFVRLTGGPVPVPGG